LGDWRRGWTDNKKHYCCKTASVGCQDELVYDCDAGVGEWKSWTDNKKHYCCKHASVGCEEATTAAPTTSFAPSTTKAPVPTPPFDLEATRTRSMSGQQCNSIKNITPAKGTFPKHCTKPVLSYKNDDQVRKQCANIEYWEKLAKQQSDDSHDHCEIDPKTKKMKCARASQTCRGGEVKTAREQLVITNLTYNCASTCKGALVIDCCDTCKSHRNDPGSLGVANVICKGCEDEELIRAASSADCVFEGGAFNCDSSGSCASGVVETKCHVTDIRCEVYPCDTCTDPQLKGQCCKKCLEKLCTDTPEDRMACQGCETLPTGQWWPWR